MGVKALVRWATGKRLTNRLPKLSLITLSPPLNRGILGLRNLSPLGYWQRVNQSPTQTKPYNTLPPFEPRDSWSPYGAVRAYSEILL